MTKLQLLGAIAGIATLVSAAQAGPPVRVGVGINVGGPYYGPYYRPYYYAPYYPYYVPPPAVIVQPAPQVIYQPAPTIVQQQPAPTPIQQQPVEAPQQTYSAPPPVLARPPASIDSLLASLRNADENVRRDTVMELGRSKAIQAVQPLSATLAGDQSPSVREAAARALGLIGSPQGLPTLQYAAQSDGDRDVRHSAQFAIEIIKSNSR